MIGDQVVEEGKEYCFRIKVVQAMDISEEYTDVFCQFKYAVKNDV